MTMRKTVIAFVLSMGLVGVAAAPASAVQSRPTYVAQAEPVCMAAIQQEVGAFTAFSKAYKRYRAVKPPTKPSTNRFIRQSVRFFSVISRVETDLNTQLSAIPVPAVPPVDPSGPIATAWLQKRGEAIGFLNQGIVALKHRNLRAFLSAVDQYDAALRAANAMVADWGFQYCA
jgi:hypothetical protein